MKAVIAITFVLFVVLDSCKAANVVTNEYKRLGDTREGYEFGFETDDGIKRDEVGTLEAAEESEGVIVMRGSYSFIAPDGQLYKVDYIADQNGYRTIQGGGGAPAAPAVRAEAAPEVTATSSISLPSPGAVSASSQTTSRLGFNKL